MVFTQHRVPVSGLKGYLGHTLGASGAIELVATLEMMRRGCIYPTRNLETVAADCEGIQHVIGKPLSKSIDRFVKTSFAFGGINAVLACARV